MPGRVRAELAAGVLHVYRGPDPECLVCGGTGGTLAVSEAQEHVETVLCPCWNPAAGLRIRILPRRRERAPF